MALREALKELAKQLVSRFLDALGVLGDVEELNEILDAELPASLKVEVGESVVNYLLLALVQRLSNSY